jgi:hypothetical protein
MVLLHRLSPAVLALLLAGSACGDDGRPADDGTGSATLSEPLTGEAPSTGDITPTDGASATDTQGSVSDSLTATTGPDPTATDSATDSATGTTGGGTSQCAEDPPQGFIGPFDATCKTEPQQGVFTPVVEWHKDTFMTSPGANASATAPIVIQVNDDDMDGAITENDIPDVVNILYDLNNMSQSVLRAISGDGSSEVLSVVIPGGGRPRSSPDA